MPGSDASNNDVARRQAVAFIAHLEAMATQLAQQVDALEGAAAMPRPHQRQRLIDDAKRRRLELYETRAHIEALQKRYHLDPCPG
jgi:hypothetical protein